MASEGPPKRVSAYAVHTRNTRASSSNDDSSPVKEKKVKDDIKTEPDVPIPKTKGRKRKIPVEEPEALVQNIKYEDKKTDEIVQKRKGRKKKIPVEEPEAPIQNIKNEEKESNENVGAEAPVSPKPEAITEAAFGPEPEPDESNEVQGSVPCGNAAANVTLRWFLHPNDPDIFFQKTLDKRPMYIPRKNSNYYQGLFSTEDFDKIMKENNLNYQDEIDVVAYVDNERRPVINEMKVYPSFIWKCFKEGNSIRMRNPQVYHKQLWKLCSLLQEYFGSVFGVNMYLTPANSQGFPPHYDDIDAFILQIEGSKMWKLYKTRNAEEALSRFSSGDLEQDDIGDPFFEIEMTKGDLLYFPRGCIHQALTTDEHSLHLTFSCNQLNTWGDLLLAGIPHAVEKAIKNEKALRKSLPKDYMNYVGASYSECNTTETKLFENKYKDLAQEAMKYLSVDYAADVHAANFIHGSIPPFFSQVENRCSVHGNGNRCENGKVLSVKKLTKTSKIRFIRKRAFRLVIDEEGSRLFYSLGNSKNSKESDALFLEIDTDAVPAINKLFQTHPDYVEVSDLPVDSSFQLNLAQELFDNGFLMTEEPLPLE